ncbi:Protein kinase domain [Dillenia turbinata]|uniref:Serine/threonine-protein kinase PRP4 homolog n=1 Tax=Dillenia turbinata TaxID=194707 RepID=A0AAN8UTJ1_9MAGN
MASDKHESKRKHRRSPDNELEESSKRHKHHNRHHHRRHRSRHRDETKKREDEIRNEEEDLKREDLPSLPPPPPVIYRQDYDMEEGEIVEEDEEFAKKKPDSDVESGEIDSLKALANDSDNLQSEGNANAGILSGEGRDANIKEKGIEVENNIDLDSNSTVDRKEKKSYKSEFDDKFNDEVDVPRDSFADTKMKNHANGYYGRASRNEDSEPRTESRLSPSKRGSEEKSYYDNEKKNLTVNEGKTLPSDSRGEKYKKLTRSPSCDKTLPSDRARERSRSQSVLEETSLSKLKHYREQDSYAENSIRRRVSDDDERHRYDRDYQHGRRDLMKDKRGERAESHGRCVEQEEREQSVSHSKYLERDEREQGVSYSRYVEHEERERSVSHSRYVEREERERSISHNRYSDREDRRWEARSRDERREVGRNRKRDKEQDWKVDRNEKTDREHDRSTDGDRERDRDRDRERARERDRARDRERARERERDRDRKWEQRDREDDRIRNRKSERDREREKDIERDRKSGRSRDTETDRDRRHNTRDGYSDRDKNSDSKYSKVCDSEAGLLEQNESKLKRVEDEQEDYQESIIMEQEEDDINRIKEESRRRMQAILEKYKSQTLLQEPHSQPVDLGKDKMPTGLPGDSTAIVNAKNDGADVYVVDPSLGKSPLPNGTSAPERASAAAALGEGSPKSERSADDMFCDDIFGESPAGVRKPGKGDGLLIERSGLHDNWDDAEGYYSYRFGEILDGRYEVIAAHGKGVFSTVVRAKDLKAGKGDPEEVAIKIIRNNDTMYKAGMDELVILKKLAGADPEDKRHCVRYLSSFKYRNHLCLVFESLHMNLREVLKRFGRNIGLKLTAVRAYAKQLFIALKHLKNCGVLHCDIKPDNMLVNEAKNVLKLCDFGNAMFAGKNEITPYLVSRFYRAPEIILGLPYDHPLDIWSVGCCVYELYTGRVLFPGPSNNDMLRLHMELKGPFPKKMLRKGAFIDQHFDQDLNFHATEEDPVTKKAIKRVIVNIKPKDISSIISGSPGEDPKMLANFKDLLDKVFVLDPEKRMTVSQALSHPFITGK